MDETILQRIIAVAKIDKNETVLEVGAGFGSLTRHLAQHARQVIAVELDAKLIPLLHQVVAPFQNIRIIEGDILSLDPDQLITSPEYLIVANIPYYITSAIIRHLIEANLPPKRMILSVQQEVAARICASPGDMNLLALSVQVYGHPIREFSIPPDAFYPPPQVSSEVVQIEIYTAPHISYPLLNTYFTLIKAGFSQKRKTLRNALSGGLRLPPLSIESLLNAASIDPRRRAETLSLDEWKKLTEQYHKQSYVNP